MGCRIAASMRLIVVGLGLIACSCSGVMRSTDGRCQESSSGLATDASVCDVERVADTNKETKPIADAGSPTMDGSTLAELDASVGTDSGTPGRLPIPVCEANATTMLVVVANLDPDSTPPTNAWGDTKSSWASQANFSSTLSVYDRIGNPNNLDLYFTNMAAGSWRYHAVLNGQSIGAAGNLTFGVDGALQHIEVIQPVVVRGSDGTATAINLDLGTPTDQGGTGFDGLTCSPGPCNVSFQYADGNASRFGVSCPNARKTVPNVVPSSDTSDIPSLPVCAVRATTVFRLRANLYEQCEIHPIWDATSPRATSSFHTDLTTVDSRGRPAALSLYYQKTAADHWSYHVLLDGDVGGVEIGSGALEFNTDGTLRETRVEAPLVLPVTDTKPVPITLDFGSGADGLTQFDTGSVTNQISSDGSGGGSGALCPENPEQTVFQNTYATAEPRWASEFTTFITVQGNLAPAAPVVRDWSIEAPDATSTLAITKPIFDVQGTPVPFTIYFRCLNERTWEYHALVSMHEGRVEVASGLLPFNINGQLESHPAPQQFRIPFKGRPSPLITLDIAAFGGNLVSNAGWTWPQVILQDGHGAI
jgi:flagellar hook protein FlgE